MPQSVDHGFAPGHFAFFDIESYDVGAWCRDSLAQLPPEQVHLTVRIKGASRPLVMRFKSAAAMNLMIGTLTRYRNEVWPEPAP